jgi:hypothetical protein
VKKMQKIVSNCPFQLKKLALILIVFCLDLLSRWWYRLGCKGLTALLTLTEERLKDQMFRQNKRFHEFLYKYVHHSDGGMTAQPPVTFRFHLANKASLACARGKV